MLRSRHFFGRLQLRKSEVPEPTPAPTKLVRLHTLKQLSLFACQKDAAGAALKSSHPSHLLTLLVFLVLRSDSTPLVHSPLLSSFPFCSLSSLNSYISHLPSSIMSPLPYWHCPISSLPSCNVSSLSLVPTRPVPAPSPPDWGSAIFTTSVSFLILESN